jgi:hypothetical protein
VQPASKSVVDEVATPPGANMGTHGKLLGNTLVRILTVRGTASSAESAP